MQFVFPPRDFSLTALANDRRLLLDDDFSGHCISFEQIFGDFFVVDNLEMRTVKLVLGFCFIVRFVILPAPLDNAVIRPHLCSPWHLSDNSHKTLHLCKIGQAMAEQLIQLVQHRTVVFMRKRAN